MITRRFHIEFLFARDTATRDFHGVLLHSKPKMNINVNHIKLFET